MEEKIETQVQEINKDLTFGEIFRLLKKGAALLVVCLIIGVILATSVLLVAKEVMGTTSYETEITFSSASISDDEEYNPSTNVNTLVKSSIVISTALTNLGYNEEQQQNLLNAGLASKLSAYSKEAKDDSKGNTYPFKVVISLNKMGGKLLSKAQALAVVDEIAKQVMIELEKQYKYEISFDGLNEIDYSQYNYLQVCDKIDNAIANVKSFENSLSKNALDYKKRGISIKSALARFDAIESELIVLKQKLINNVIANTSASSSELDYATYNSNYYTQRAAQLNTRISDYADLLKDTKPDITVTTSGVTIDALNKYYELVDEYNKLQDEYLSVSTKATEWDAIKTAYSGATTQDETVKTQFNNIIATYNSAYALLGEVVGTYNEDSYASTIVSKTGNATVVKNSSISALIILLVDVVVVVLIMIVVVLVQMRKEQKLSIIVKKEQGKE